MTYCSFYTNPMRADDPHALPDAEVFYVSEKDAAANEDPWRGNLEPGWYWWSCFPGCLPDSDPVGPFCSKSAAMEDARDIGAL